MKPVFSTIISLWRQLSTFIFQIIIVAMWQNKDCHYYAEYN